MGKGLVRIGDASDHGGSMISAGSTVKAGGKLLCIDGDMHSCPIPGHGVTPITGTSKVKSAGKKILRIGDTAGCGATLVSGDAITTSD